MLIHSGNRGRGREGMCVCLSLIVRISVDWLGEQGDIEREPLCVSVSLVVCNSVDSFGEQGDRERERESLCVSLFYCLYRC